MVLIILRDIVPPFGNRGDRHWILIVAQEFLVTLNIQTRIDRSLKHSLMAKADLP